MNPKKYTKLHTHKKNKTIPDNNDHYGVEIKMNEERNCPEDIQPLKERYQDVNKNEIKFLGKVWVNIEYNNIQTNLPLLITKRTDITPLLGVYWLKQLPITINGTSLNKENNQSETAIHNKIQEAI